MKPLTSLSLALVVTLASINLAGCVGMESAEAPPAPNHPSASGDAPKTAPNWSLPGILDAPPALVQFTSTYLDEGRALARTVPRDNDRFSILLEVGEEKLAQAESFLRQGLASEALTSGMHAKWFLSFVKLSSELTTTEAQRGYASSYPPFPRISNLSDSLNATRGRVNETGLLMLVLAETYAVMALEAAPLYEERRATSNQYPGWEFARTWSGEAIQISLYAELGERLVGEAGRTRGALPSDWNADELIEQARGASARLPKNDRLEGESHTAYDQAKNVLPSRMRLLTSLGWTEGAALTALDILAYARTQERFNANLSTTQEEAASALQEIANHSKTPLAHRTQSQAWLLYLQGREDSSRLNMVVELARLSEKREEVYRSLSAP